MFLGAEAVNGYSWMYVPRVTNASLFRPMTPGAIAMILPNNSSYDPRADPVSHLVWCPPARNSRRCRPGGRPGNKSVWFCTGSASSQVQPSAGCLPTPMRKTAILGNAGRNQTATWKERVTDSGRILMSAQPQSAHVRLSTIEDPHWLAPNRAQDHKTTRWPAPAPETAERGMA